MRKLLYFIPLLLVLASCGEYTKVLKSLAILGIYVVYVAIALFTKHGQSEELPGVEGKTYTEAVNILHKRGNYYILYHFFWFSPHVENTPKC